MIKFKIKPALIVGITSATLVLGSGAVYGNYYLSKKIFPFVKVGQFDIGGKEYNQAFDTLKEKYNEKNTLTIVNKTQEKSANYKTLGIQFKNGETLKNAYKIGRSWNFDFTINPKISINYTKLNDTLNQLFPEIKKDPVDAKYVLKDNKLQIESQQYGVSFNAVLIGQSIEKGILDPKWNQKIKTITKRSQPTILTEHLEYLTPQAKEFIDTNPVLIINNKNYSPTPEQALSFIKVNIENGEPTIAIMEDNLKKYISDLNKKTIIAATPDIYFDTGELSSKGISGKKIDEDNAYSQLETAYLSKNETTIKLAMVDVPSSKKVINRAYTPGLYEGKYIEIDLSSQQLFQFDGQNLIATHKVSTGKWSMPTPTGTFSINSKNPRAYSPTYNLYMPYWMAFIGSKYGIHELPEWANGYKEGQNHLGTPVSHGCIRLGVGDAQAVYDWVDVGTPVVIHK